MRAGFLERYLGVGVAVTFVLGLLALPAIAQEDQDHWAYSFPRTTATITLTDTGMTIEPSRLSPGSVNFTIRNNSSRTRGVYMTGQDRAGSPIIKYTSRLNPGSSTNREFWLYQGNTYTFRDYTSREIRNGESVFVSTYSTQVTIPVLVPTGGGPQFIRRTGTIVVTNNGIRVNPRSTEFGPIDFTIVNESSKQSGVIITGEDRSGSPIIRYSRILPPGGRTTTHFWLFENRTYTVRDYSLRRVPGGFERLTGNFSDTITVAPGDPSVGNIGRGPSMDRTDYDDSDTPID
jgi:hypothetical protein